MVIHQPRIQNDGHSPVAQLVEHCSDKAEVAGANPVGATMENKYTFTIPIIDGKIWVDEFTYMKPDVLLEAYKNFELELKDIIRNDNGEITSARIIGVSLCESQ